MGEESSDEELLEGYFGGQVKAFDLFFQRHFHRVVHYVSKRGFSEAQAQDVAQEVFLKLHRHIHQYELGRPALPWFFTLVHYTFVDFYRRGKNSREQDRSLEDLGDSTEIANVTESPVHGLESWDDALSGALNALSAEQRGLVELRALEQLSFAEIALKTGKTEAAARKAYQRAVQSLRDHLPKKGPTP